MLRCPFCDNEVHLTEYNGYGKYVCVICNDFTENIMNKMLEKGITKQR